MATHTLPAAASTLAAAPIVERLRALELMARGETIDALFAAAARIGLQAEGQRLTGALRAATVWSRGNGR